MSESTAEEQLERAGRRLNEALARIAEADIPQGGVSTEPVFPSGESVAADTSALEARITALEAENTRLREAAEAVAEGIEDTIDALKIAKA